LRERFRPKGGPDGGDGGRGGDVVLVATSQRESLAVFSRRKRFVAQNGGHGRGKNQHGRDAPELLVYVPLGTLVRDASTGELLGDLTHEGQRLKVASGGHGGRGNARFATPTRQAPRFTTPPGQGEERWVLLELKLLADVGIIGLPNAGKSTLLSRLSAARPKIAPYPFTTLFPHLGVIESLDGDRITVADIPGLVEGAHQGVGLGLRFLRHVERTRLLLYLLDLDPRCGRDPVVDLRILQDELERYNDHLARKPRIVALNKIDLPGAVDRVNGVREGLERQGLEVFSISALTGQGVGQLRQRLLEAVRAMMGAAVPEEGDGGSVRGSCRS